MASQPPTATQIVAVAPARTTWKDWLPAIALLLTIAGVLIVSGKTMGQIADNTRRIDSLERRADERDDQLRDMQARIAGMDGKLDLLLLRMKDAEQ